MAIERSGALIATDRMDTDALPVDAQFEAWAGHSPNTRMIPAQPGPFLARGAFWDRASAAVMESRMDGFAAERDEALINASDADHYLIVALFEGERAFPGDGHRRGLRTRRRLHMRFQTRAC